MDIWVAFIAGLAGSAHCATMCGSISATLGMGAKAPVSYVLAYNLSRVASYCSIAFILSLLIVETVPVVSNLAFILRAIAGVMMILMGLFLLGRSSGLAPLERLGGVLWRYISPLASRVMPVNSLPKAAALGALWGWLPCGLVYSMLAISIAQVDVVSSVTTMLAFGLGTVPAMYVIGLLGATFSGWVTQKRIRYFLAYCVIVLGVYTVFMSVMHMSGSDSTQVDHSHHGHSMH